MMANNRVNTSQDDDDVDDAYGEVSLRAYHEGPNWYEDGLDEIDAFLPSPHNSPPLAESPSTIDTVPDGALESAPASVEQSLPLPLAHDSIAVLQEGNDNSGEDPASIRPEQAAPSSPQHGGNVASAPRQTSQSSILPLTSGSGNEQEPFPRSLFASEDYRDTVTSSAPEHQEIYRGPDAISGTEEPHTGPSASDTNVPHIYNATSPDPADVRDETEIPSRSPKRKKSDASSTSDQPLKKKAKVSAGISEDGSDEEMVDQEEVDLGDSREEGLDEGDEGDEEEVVPTTTIRGRGRGRGRPRGRGRVRGGATAVNATAHATAATRALFDNNTLPPKYPFDQPRVSNATIEGNWSRYGFVSLAAARTWVIGRS
ncbi:hypothetical protein BDV97DRAFT_206502 [Delphinella strobiligena]|nr:hypothetical protein BDV97DRAFT_206502 [Delphinella strobiligena]